MLDWVIKRLKLAIIAVINKESNLAKNILTAKKWKILNYIRDFLRRFYFAIKITKDYAVTLERVLFIMNFLVNRFETAIQ